MSFRFNFNYMIRYKNDIFEDYFIDKMTGKITRADGSEVLTRIHGSYLCIKNEGKLCGLPIHVIQVHTHVGYSSEIAKLHVHHIDNNPLNNSLENLALLTNSEHQKIHFATTRVLSAFKDQSGEKNYMYGKKYKWINDGSKSKLLFYGEELPDGWKYGRILTDDARKAIAEHAHELGVSMKGKPKTQEAREKMSAAQKGKKMPEEAKAKISASLKGRKLGPKSEETKVKLSTVLKGKINGMIFWNNGEINRRSKECPGPGWKKGRLNRR